MSKFLRLGVIGLSPGNGHPYSWSAIFNGYDPVYMENCGFPLIPRYLERQRFPEDAIPDAKVTHVWTQEPKLSRHIAKAALIENVSKDLHDLVGSVDGVLLARDDAHRHLEMAKPFLKAGLPVYIDKPLAFTIVQAKRLIDLQKYPGQIFSCSALKYAPELMLDKNQIKQVGKIFSVHGFIPNDWDKYSIHAIEPILQIIQYRDKIRRYASWKSSDRITLMLEFANGIEAQIHLSGMARTPFSFRIMGSKGSADLFFTDTFRAFRNTLKDFVDGILQRDVRTSSEHMLEVVKLIELGRKL